MLRTPPWAPLDTEMERPVADWTALLTSMKSVWVPSGRRRYIFFNVQTYISGPFGIRQTILGGFPFSSPGIGMRFRIRVCTLRAFLMMGVFIVLMAVVVVTR